jgi:2-methylisocitrate lyase-like PEP mutase family enzyme
MSMGRRLRQLLQEKKFILSMGIETAVHAKIVERAGFDFAYIGGYDVSLALLGLPDFGLITEPEMVANARNIARAVDIPVVCDADTGYGNALNVIRTVQNFEASGVAAIHIEDQVSPKRCGHVAGKMIVPVEEAVGKLKAALDARKDPDFVIMARTDAVAAVGGGLDEAIRRGKEYARIGCDMLFCEFPSADIEYPRRFAREMRKAYPALPLYFNYSSNLKWHEFPLTTFDALAEMGYRAMHVASVPAPSMQAVGLRRPSARCTGGDRSRAAPARAPDGPASRIRGHSPVQGTGGEIPAGRRVTAQVRRCGRVIEFAAALRQSTLSPETRIASPMLFQSLATRCANSAALLVKGSAPTFFRASFVAASLMVLRSSSCSLP